MVLPIVAYGDPVLRKKCEPITADYRGLTELIANMRETMAVAYGVGLAAPQVGVPIRLFVIDTSPFADDEDLSAEEQAELAAFNKVLINAEILEESGEEWDFNEGCLSIPDVREDVSRKETLVIRYQDENFVEHTETYSGLIARVIQHEYDHIEGIMFTDKLSPFKKRLIKGRLGKISQGKIDVDYPMRFPAQKNKRR